MKYAGILPCWQLNAATLDIDDGIPARVYWKVSPTNLFEIYPLRPVRLSACLWPALMNCWAANIAA
ncbi:hypothetical protein KCP77_11755 [Salmonella enterica subsp. enterica]|nr:hypothetical protein KCP77_11755 [Salmonella enterica subsp. enterica]